jgi:hypothetical protein
LFFPEDCDCLPAATVVQLAGNADKLPEAMLRSASVLFTLLLQLACTLPSDADLKTPTDDVRRVAQDLRWRKQSRAIARIDMAEFTPPVAVLAVPPGTHALGDLEQLFPAGQGREWVRGIAGGRPLTTDTPTIYVLGARQMMSSLPHDEASIPKPVGVWKESMGDIGVLLERQGDDVRLVGLQ